MFLIMIHWCAVITRKFHIQYCWSEKITHLMLEKKLKLTFWQSNMPAHATWLISGYSVYFESITQEPNVEILMPCDDTGWCMSDRERDNNHFSCLIWISSLTSCWVVPSAAWIRSGGCRGYTCCCGSVSARLWSGSHGPRRKLCRDCRYELPSLWQQRGEGSC